MHANYTSNCEYSYFCEQILAFIFYILEYWKLDFRNPAFISFWLLESIAYLVLSYSASLNLGLYVRTRSISLIRSILVLLIRQSAETRLHPLFTTRIVLLQSEYVM